MVKSANNMNEILPDFQKFLLDRSIRKRVISYFYSFSPPVSAKNTTACVPVLHFNKNIIYLPQKISGAGRVSG